MRCCAMPQVCWIQVYPVNESVSYERVAIQGFFGLHVAVFSREEDAEIGH